MTQGIHDGHRQRVKNRFIKSGIDDFEPHNVLELMLFYAIPKRDTNELAHNLIETFGSFDKVLEADYLQLAAVKGMGEHSATLLKLFIESYGYYERQKYKDGFIATSSAAVISYAQSLFVGETRELGYLLCFDAKLQLINCVKISEGSVNAASVSVRRVVETATANKAISVILTHNHPNGLPVPSTEDVATTKKIMSALSTVDIDFSDHIIVGAKSAISLADEGIIYSIKQEKRR